jgi:type I restriction enzyme S subunit
MPIAKQIVSGSTPSRQRVKVNDFYNIQIPLPSLIEQNEIANILQKLDEKVEAEIDKKQALEELFRTLLEKLMTGQIRVNDLDLEEIQT